jgi:hypothetical protein
MTFDLKVSLISINAHWAYYTTVAATVQIHIFFPGLKARGKKWPKIMPARREIWLILCPRSPKGKVQIMSHIISRVSGH